MVAPTFHNTGSHNTNAVEGSRKIYKPWIITLSVSWWSIMPNLTSNISWITTISKLIPRRSLLKLIISIRFDDPSTPRTRDLIWAFLDKVTGQPRSVRISSLCPLCSYANKDTIHQECGMEEQWSNTRRPPLLDWRAHTQHYETRTFWSTARLSF
jgi:hypothetical protein